ncbi:trans-2,3-dihydro-3-hydroxyanthranilate isomerase [Hoeflea halophila]|uniref:Trans-2,3-dihydro-3-hydroxyanthranilate isomerase n=1 Tax=Hoeflea halophila TaxID=714899 RepID=A0A286HRT0_9HYPH|nr:PhzF family phenazine biosynthesis protein [Hoeflea halophila]SOE10447.1 trans-2,3-dihydro-3-hydroxyanthranilate isomerase [Hoeflea halophila]
MSDYAVYDVFTDTGLAGNPLAVVFDADSYSDQQMQAIAREFNLSETVFVLKPENPAHTARLRIFTSMRELPFAGHPTVGAAVALAERRLGGAVPDNGLDLVKMLEEAIGPVRCAVRVRPGAAGFAEFDLPKLSRQFDVEIEPADVGVALGLDPHEIGFENHRVSLWSAGVPFVLVPVHDLAAAAKAECIAAEWDRIAPMCDGQLAFAYVYCRGGVNHASSFHARMFAPGDGMPEDPATGSAAAALSGAIHHFDGLLDGNHALVIEQGVEMGRPSLIHLHIDSAGNQVSHVRIGGEAVRVAEGKLLV